MKKAALLTALCGLVLVAAVGTNPRYLEELRVGGGFGDSADGGADFEADGDITTDGDIAANGDLAVDGGDITSSQNTLRLDPGGTGKIECVGSSGKLRICNDALAETSEEFRMWNNANASTMYGGIYCTIADSTTASEDGKLSFALTKDGSVQYDLLEIDAGGNVTAAGDLCADGGDIMSAASVLRLRPSGGGYLDVVGGPGKLRLFREAASNGSIDFYMWNSASASKAYGQLFCSIDDATSGSEDGSLAVALVHEGTMAYRRLEIDSGGNGVFEGNTTSKGGQIVAGVAGTTRGLVTICSGAGGACPGCIKLASPNGTQYFLFVEDDGTLRVHSALPTQNSDGDCIGEQTD